MPALAALCGDCAGAHKGSLPRCTQLQCRVARIGATHCATHCAGIAPPSMVLSDRQMESSRANGTRVSGRRFALGKGSRDSKGPSSSSPFWRPLRWHHSSTPLRNSCCCRLHNTGDVAQRGCCGDVRAPRAHRSRRAQCVPSWLGAQFLVRASPLSRPTWLPHLCRHGGPSF